MAKRVQFSDLPVVEYQAGDTIAAYRNGQVVRIPVGGGGGEMPDLATVATTGQYSDLLGKPTLGSAASMSSSAFATAAQGAMAATALQPASIGVSVQAYSAILSATTSSFTTALKTKLDAIAVGATKNATDAALRDRSTHTGTQAMDTVTGLQLELDGKLGSTATAAAATKLATARTINGTSFDGSANITTANWGVARAFTIGATAKGVNGAGNVSWTLTEIGAAAAIHSHSAATTLADGFLSASDKAKLDGIETGATANATDAALRARSSHTGTQPASTITGLAAVATSGSYNDLSNKPTIPTLPATVSQAEAEAGSATTTRLWTSQRVRQNVAAFTYSKQAIDDKIDAGGSDSLTLAQAQAIALYF